MGISPIWILLLQLSSVLAHSYQETDFDGWYQPVARRPVDVVTDIVNDLGVRILQQYNNIGNVAFSPIGVAFVLAALYEGSAGGGSRQIAEALALPHERDITRIGFRDIHRRLRTYLNADGFLGGLTLNKENTKLRTEYEDILRFYGFNLSDTDENELNDTTTTTNAPPTTESLSEDSTKPTTIIIDVSQPSVSSPVITESTELPVTSTISSMTETFGTTIDDKMVSENLTQMSNITTTAEISNVTESNTLPTTVSDVNLETMSPNSPVSIQLPTVTTQSETMQSTMAVGQTTIEDTSTIIPDISDSMSTTTTTMTESQTTVNTATTNSMQNMGNTTMMMMMMPTTSTLTVTTIIAPITSLDMQGSSMDSTSGQTEAMTLPMDTSTPIQTNITTTSVSVTANMPSNLEVVPPTDESTVSTNQPTTSGPITMPGIVDLGSTNSMNQDGQETTTTVPVTLTDASGNRLRKRSTRNSRGYFSSYPDEGIWMQDLGIWKTNPIVKNEASVRDSTEISFLVNGCDVSSVMATRYVAVLPFAYFPSLQAVAVEFPLDDPRYNILLLMPTDRTDTHRLARNLGGKSLRWLRKQLQPAWVRATIPSFMLRGFVTLTPFLQRLGITDVFEPRVADLSPMTPDLGVYVRDVQQSIGVNIRNYMKPDRTHSRNGLFERAGPVPFTVVHPFLYFIIDTETSVTLIAGRVDDPLNSRII
ncbi:PREDICTED: mucin-17 isoform X2 [Polistes dominula]|uniref:Mucin-17 isoform X2 n=1 Tax=Polistes dominula TaxID=743375 RepID=A0ABM1HZG2_POLDO|nr:PREDICTED: mucin-17 isoform X2 [Polistes dominula]